MKEFRLVQELILKNGEAVDAAGQKITMEKTAVDLAVFYSNFGADMLMIRDISDTDEEHEKNIDTVKEIVSNTDAPVLLGGNVKRLEDVKKYIYAGAVMAVLDFSKESNRELLKEASDRFGKEKIAVEFTGGEKNSVGDYADCVICDTEFKWKENISGRLYHAENTAADFHAEKAAAKKAGIPVIIYEPQVAFSDLKTDAHGLIPVIVQDYKTNEVLMLAYMNEEAYCHTMESGRMTYYSRSRKELWEKGMTSGHFQYWKELTADCDSDTILAKVYQVGAACHTGKRSCFFQQIVKKDYTERNPYKVFEDVFRVILDWKEHPKEGSYTNYLFDKGIDKILKKCGEEATEIVIAAKNPNPEEIKYEISDFLYHVMVLMAEKGITWEDITTELARR
ncbi:MAG: bifunctional phosphoribosyl-AMP cyclohydrolase/phosphoribosyl-ATP diphosphatase HisIE [Lachnospiraceae bacterium]